MIFTSIDNRLKEFIYTNLYKDPQKQTGEMSRKIVDNIKKRNYDFVKEIMRVIKFLIKDDVDAEIKFYGLQMLKEIMKNDEKEVVEYFIKKLMSRLFLIAQSDMKTKNPGRGQRCLFKYHKNTDARNLDFSNRFFTLLLECWKRWDEMYSENYPKIKKQCDQLRTIFPINEVYYSEVNGSVVAETQETGNEPNLTSFRRDQDVRKFGQPGIEFSEEPRPIKTTEVQQESSDSSQLDKFIYDRKIIFNKIKNSSHPMTIESIERFQARLVYIQNELQKNLANSIHNTTTIDRFYTNKIRKELELIEEALRSFSGFLIGRFSIDDLKSKISEIDGNEQAQSRNSSKVISSFDKNESIEANFQNSVKQDTNLNKKKMVSDSNNDVLFGARFNKPDIRNLRINGEILEVSVEDEESKLAISTNQTQNERNEVSNDFSMVNEESTRQKRLANSQGAPGSRNNGPSQDKLSRRKGSDRLVSSQDMRFESMDHDDKFSLINKEEKERIIRRQTVGTKRNEEQYNIDDIESEANGFDVNDFPAIKIDLPEMKRPTHSSNQLLNSARYPMGTIIEENSEVYDDSRKSVSNMNELRSSLFMHKKTSIFGNNKDSAKASPLSQNQYPQTRLGRKHSQNHMISDDEDPKRHKIRRNSTDEYDHEIDEIYNSTNLGDKINQNGRQGKHAYTEGHNIKSLGNEQNFELFKNAQSTNKSLEFKNAFNERFNSDRSDLALFERHSVPEKKSAYSDNRQINSIDSNSEFNNVIKNGNNENLYDSKRSQNRDPNTRVPKFNTQEQHQNTPRINENGDSNFNEMNLKFNNNEETQKRTQQEKINKNFDFNKNQQKSKLGNSAPQNQQFNICETEQKSNRSNTKTVSPARNILNSNKNGISTSNNIIQQKNEINSINETKSWDVNSVENRSKPKPSEVVNSSIHTNTIKTNQQSNAGLPDQLKNEYEARNFNDLLKHHAELYSSIKSGKPNLKLDNLLLSSINKLPEIELSRQTVNDEDFVVMDNESERNFEKQNNEALLRFQRESMKKLDQMRGRPAWPVDDSSNKFDQFSNFDSNKRQTEEEGNFQKKKLDIRGHQINEIQILSRKSISVDKDEMKGNISPSSIAKPRDEKSQNNQRLKNTDEDITHNYNSNMSRKSPQNINSKSIKGEGTLSQHYENDRDDPSKSQNRERVSETSRIAHMERNSTTNLNDQLQSLNASDYDLKNINIQQLDGRQSKQINQINSRTQHLFQEEKLDQLGLRRKQSRTPSITVENQEKIEFTGEKIINLNQIAIKDSMKVTSFTKANPNIGPLDPEQHQKLIQMKIQNDYLNDQVKLLQNRLSEQNKSTNIIENQIAENHVFEGRRNQIATEFNTQSVDEKIVERKNKYLSMENKMLKKVNKESKNKQKQIFVNHSEKPMLYKKLNKELSEYVKTLKTQLGNLIRRTKSSKQIDTVKKQKCI